MRSSRTLQLGAVAALGCVIAAAALWIVTGGMRSAEHVDGAGPLGSEGAPVGLTKANDPLGGSITSWTYGVRLCRLSGDDPVVLESIGPRATVGSGFRFLGASVREFDYDIKTTAPIISTIGYPPPPPYAAPPFHELAGYEVRSACSSPPIGTYTELLVGLALVGDDGGGWNGLNVTYKAAGQTRVLTLDRDLLICGRSVDLCSAP